MIIVIIIIILMMRLITFLLMVLLLMMMVVIRKVFVLNEADVAISTHNLWTRPSAEVLGEGGWDHRNHYIYVNGIVDDDGDHKEGDLNDYICVDGIIVGDDKEGVSIG